VLGGYRIEDLIGMGGMAIVYRAEQLSLGRKVALKFLAPKLSLDEAFRERFRREGKHVAALDHPNVVTIYDSGEADGRLYLAMRLVEGTTLADDMHSAPLSAERTLRLLGPIADALDTAHALGLVHRDVKPQNILLSRSDHPYLADFGVAKAIAGVTTGLTATGGFIGSIHYASPEQILGQTPTAASDVYALTAVLYQCLAGQVPYPLDTDVAVIHAHVVQPPPRVSVLAPDAAALDVVIARGMAKDPMQRYAGAGDLITDAARALSEVTKQRRHSIRAFGVAGTIVVPATDRTSTSGDSQSASGDSQSASGDAQSASGDAQSASGDAQSEADDAQSEADDFQSASGTPADRRREVLDDTEASPLRSRRRALALVGGATACLAAGVAVVLAAAGAPTNARAASARSGPLALSYASPWRSATADVSTEASGLRNQFALTDGHALLTVGAMSELPPIPGNLSPALLSRYGSPSSAATIRIAGGPARRYVWLAGGERRLALIVATNLSDLALVCSVRQPDTGALSRCQALAARATIATQTIAPGVDSTVTAAVALSLRPLGRAGRVDASLAAAELSARAAPAASLAALYGAAARSVTSTKPLARNRQAIAQMAAALTGEARAWSSLSVAARDTNRRVYASARAELRAAHTALNTAVAGLREQGFSVATISTPTPAAPPPVHRRHPPSTAAGSAAQNSAAAQTSTSPQTYTTPVTRAGTSAAQTNTAPAQTYTSPAQTYTPPSQSTNPPSHSSSTSPASSGHSGSGGGQHLVPAQPLS